MLERYKKLILKPNFTKLHIFEPMTFTTVIITAENPEIMYIKFKKRNIKTK